MTWQWFYMIHINLNIVDNLCVPEDELTKNRLRKIQPVIAVVRNRCRAIERKETAFTIDEQMIPFLGRCSFRQFVKNFVGLVLDLNLDDIYHGNTTPLKNTGIGHVSNFALTRK